MSAQEDIISQAHDVIDRVRSQAHDVVERVRAELFMGQVNEAMLMAALKISKATLERYKANGLPHYRVGRRPLFDIEAVRGWITSHQQKNAPARPRGRPRKV